MRSLILFLIRLKLGVKKYESFRFTNQKKKDVYTIDNAGVWKSSPNQLSIKKESDIGLNWVLSDNCRITKVR